MTSSSLMALPMRNRSPRTVATSPTWVNTAPKESIDKRDAPIERMAYSIRAISAPRSYSPVTTGFSPGGGDASTNAHFFSASHSSMFQPKLRICLRRALGDSSKVTKTPASPVSRMPLARNWLANTVFALPAVPATNVVAHLGNPPSAIRSKPAIPVASFSTHSRSSSNWSLIKVINFYARRSNGLNHVGKIALAIAQSNWPSSKPIRTRSRFDKSPIVRLSGGGSCLIRVGVTSIFSDSARLGYSKTSMMTIS